MATSVLAVESAISNCVLYAEAQGTFLQGSIFFKESSF